MLNLDLGAETESQLAVFAASTGKSVEDAAREAIRSYLLYEQSQREFIPNAETKQALDEGYRGQFEGKSKTIADLFVALNQDD